MRKEPFDYGYYINRIDKSIVWMTWALLMSTVGCSPEDSRSSQGVVNGQPSFQSQSTSTSQIDGGSSTEIVNNAAAEPCPTDNLTKSCACNVNGQTAPGRQVCNVAFGWSGCECNEFPETLSVIFGNGDYTGPIENNGPARFDWKRTIPTGGLCQAGYYEGTFDGIYNSEVLSNMTVGFYSTLPVNGSVDFIILEKPGSSGELFTVSDGHFKGTALEIFPFDGDFYGTLDCTTKTFEGGLRKCFYLVVEDKYAFQGVALSQYEVTTNSFVNGMWSVTEPTTGACFYSVGLAIDDPYPDDSEFPNPPPIEQGGLLPNIFELPLSFRGGFGNWNTTFINP